MASELIAEAITDYFGERCLDYAEGCPTCEAWAEYDRIYTRPAPAATDTGLMRLSLVRGGGLEPNPNGDYIRFSQAEELLAAERVKNETQAETIDKLHGIITKLEADNAALTAERDFWKGRFESDTKAIRDLEAKLAAAQEAHKSLFGDKTMEDILWPDVKPTDLITIRVQKQIYDKARAVLGGKPS